MSDPAEAPTELHEAAEPPAPPEGVSVRSHPGAVGGIRRTRARTALAAFVLVGLLSHRAGVPASTALARALAAGVLGFLAAWAVAVAVWRHIILAQLEQARQRHVERRRTRLERRRELDEAAQQRARQDKVARDAARGFASVDG